MKINDWIATAVIVLMILFITRWFILELNKMKKVTPIKPDTTTETTQGKVIVNYKYKE